jgi:hypothetical protein
VLTQDPQSGFRLLGEYLSFGRGASPAGLWSAALAGDPRINRSIGDDRSSKQVY